MGIFAIEIFLLDFPFNRRKRTCKVYLRFQQCHINFSGVNDTDEIVSVVSLPPLKIGKKNSVVDVTMKFFTLPSP
jgi:hypothetical protein